MEVDTIRPVRYAAPRMSTKEDAEMENLTATDLLLAVGAIYVVFVVLPAMLWWLLAR